MQLFRLNQKKYARLVQMLCAVLFAMLLGLVLAAQPAQALETQKCTAQTNSDTTNEVLGATETRITWEGLSAKKESVKSVELSFPEGATFSLDDARLTLLTGADLMDRSNPATSFEQDGQTVKATLDEPAQAGGCIRIEIYEVEFPASGGEQSFTGKVTFADGTQQELTDIPSVQVTGISAAEQLSSYLSEQTWVQEWNKNTFLHLFFDPTILVTSFPQVVKGFGMALIIVFIAFPVAIPLGLLLALMRMSRSRILKALSGLYVNVVRGTPVFLQIYIAFFGLPLAFGQLPEIPLGVGVLALNSAAYQCEIFRAGIQSIDKGQFEASRSLGMNGAQTMFFVIIPQTVRRVIPTMTNEFILLYKDTSMLAAVGILEIVMYAKSIVASTGSITPYIVAACFYLLITLPLAKFVGILETKLDMDRRDAPHMKKGEPAEEDVLLANAGVSSVALEGAAASAGGPLVTAGEQSLHDAIDGKGARS